MKRFLYTLFIFLIPALSVIIAGELIVRNVPNEYKYKADWMKNNANNVEILILGTSHSFYGINPLYLEKKAFSVACSDQSLHYDYLILTKYKQKYKHLKQVILPISYFTIPWRKAEDGNDWWRITNYQVYYQLHEHSIFSKYNYFISCATPFREKLLKILKNNTNTACDSLGFGWYTKSTKLLDTTRIAGISWVKMHTVKNHKYVNNNIKEIEAIAHFCKQNNIKLILVTTPTYPTYYTQLDKEQLKLMFSTVKTIKQKYPLIYLNYLKDSRFTKDDFSDCNHLSYKGALKFTQILNKDIKNE